DPSRRPERIAQRRDGQDHRHGPVRGRPELPRDAVRPDDPLHDPQGPRPLRRAGLRSRGVHHRGLPRHPRAALQLRGADRGRPAVPGGGGDQPLRRAHPPPRPRRPRAADGRRGARGVRRGGAGAGSRKVAHDLQDDPHQQGRRGGGHVHRRPGDRRDVPHGPPGARLHRDQRRHRRPRGGGDDHPRVDAVPVLRAQGHQGAPAALRRARARGADGDGGRVRGEGGVSQHPGGARGAAGPQGRPPGEDGVRPRGGHDRHHQAPSVHHPPPHGRDERRAPGGDGDRRADGRGRIRHPEPRGAVSWLHPRGGALPVRQHAHPGARGDDQHAPQRRLPRLRRAADAVRHRGAHGPHRRGAGDGPRAPPRAQRAAPRRHQRDRAGHGRGLQRPGVAEGGRGALGLPPQTCRVRGKQPRDRPFPLLPRLRLHGQWRDLPVFQGHAGGHRDRRAHPRGQRGDGPGHAHHARADRGGRAGDPLRGGGDRAAGHAPGARQRPHGGVAHLHGGRPHPAALRGGDARADRRHDARRVRPRARGALHHQAVPEAGRDLLGRHRVHRGRLRRVRLGVRRGRSGAGPGHLRGQAAAHDHRPRDRQGHPPVHGGGADRGRYGAGGGVGAQRERGDEGRGHGQPHPHQLHHPHHTGHAAHGRDRAGESERVRSLRRQGRGRDADRRPRPRAHQRHPPHRAGRALDPGDPRSRHGGGMRFTL
ncbi:MAG: Xanthine dehydrogenase, molybdenum binding subunit, partial [uncultured Gemmatimonadetes bacterium]